MQESNTPGAPLVKNAPVSDSEVGDSSGVDQNDGLDSMAHQEQDSLSFGQMLTSTLWAALGVQNKKNRERDFTRGRATHFIYFGIGFTVFFVLGMYALVSLVLSGET